MVEVSKYDPRWPRCSRCKTFLYCAGGGAETLDGDFLCRWCANSFDDRDEMDTHTVTAPNTAIVKLPVGYALEVKGAGMLRGDNGTTRKLSSATQTIGPFERDYSFTLVATGTSTYRLVNLLKNAGVPPVVNDGGTNRDLTDDDQGCYVRMTGTGAKTVTVRPDATHAMPANGEWHIRNAAASGDVTLTEGMGVTLNPPAGGTLVVEPGMTVTLKRVAADEFDVIGLTVAA